MIKDPRTLFPKSLFQKCIKGHFWSIFFYFSHTSPTKKVISTPDIYCFMVLSDQKGKVVQIFFKCLYFVLSI